MTFWHRFLKNAELRGTEAEAVRALRPVNLEQSVGPTIEKAEREKLEKRLRKLELTAQYPDAEAVRKGLLSLVFDLADPLSRFPADTEESTRKLVELVRYAWDAELLELPKEG